MSRHIAMVALSTAGTNTWSTLLEKRYPTSDLQATHVNHERTGPILQRQRRLTNAQALMLGNRYREGATVARLPCNFPINRGTIAERISKSQYTSEVTHPKSLRVLKPPHSRCLFADVLTLPNRANHLYGWVEPIVLNTFSRCSDPTRLGIFDRLSQPIALGQIPHPL